MSDYRFYILDDKNHILSHRERTCVDDAAALDMARFLSGYHNPVELWVGDRRVGQVRRADADHASAQARAA